MAELTYRDAVARGIAQEMERDNRVVFLGEDIGKAGGVFKATVGLYEKFGPLRVRDTPISEQAILGAAMGAAMTGLRPIAEIMFADFLAVCFDYVANEMSKLRYMTNGQLSCPLVIRTGNGGGVRFGAQHSQSIENWTMMIPGIKVVAPSSPVDVDRPDGGGGARSRSRHLPRAQGALRDRRAKCPTARSSTRWEPPRSCAPAATARSSRWR